MYKIDVESLKFDDQSWVSGLNAVKNEINSRGSHLVADWYYLDVNQCFSQSPSVEIVFRFIDQAGREYRTAELNSGVNQKKNRQGF